MDAVILAVAALIGLYMAINIGSNDLANAMGTSVGSGALTLKGAVIVSVIANTLGAALAGGYVTDTISKGMVDPALLAGSPDKLMLGMFGSLIAGGIWVNLATLLALPVSTTHAIVGAVVGFGVVAVGPGAVSWGKVISVAVSWVSSPVAGGLIGGSMYYFVDKKIMAKDEPSRASERFAPWLVFLVLLVLFLSLMYEGLKNLNFEVTFLKALLLSLPCAALAGHLGGRWVRRHARTHTKAGFTPVDRLFAYLQILTASYVAFAHGANDVANAIGPLAAIFSVVKSKCVQLCVEVPFWMLVTGGMAVGGGLLAFGTRVIQTIGKRITEITPVRGFCAEFGTATTILICSRLGLPVSTTHVLVGAVVGVGVMRGMGSIDLRILRQIALSWIVTLPFTLLLSMILYKLLTWVFM